MFPRNALIATGALVFVYLFMKMFVNSSDKTSKKETKAAEPEVTKEETGEDTTESTEQDLVQVDSEVSKKRMKLRPNFFVAFKVNNVAIHKKIKELQEKLIARNSALFPALINVSTLHVTLAVTHLANEADIKAIKVKLDEWAEKNVNNLFAEPCILSFSQVKTFHNVVAYVDIDQCSNYKKIVEVSNSVNNILSSAGFTIDNRIFKPHLTFLKLSKDFNLLKSRRNFRDDFESLKKCQEHFGKQEVTSIQLLSMDEPKDKTGYYSCYHEIKVSEAQPNMDHSECCSPIKPVVLKVRSVNKKQTKRNKK